MCRFSKWSCMCHAGLREHSVELGGSALLKQSIMAVRSDYSSVTSRLWGMRRAGLRSFSSRLTFSCFIAEPNVVVGGQGKWDPALPPECQQLLKRPFNWISSCPARLLIESAASRLPQIWTCSIGKTARLASAKGPSGTKRSEFLGNSLRNICADTTETPSQRTFMKARTFLTSSEV